MFRTQQINHTKHTKTLTVTFMVNLTAITVENTLTGSVTYDTQMMIKLRYLSALTVVTVVTLRQRIGDFPKYEAKEIIF